MVSKISLGYQGLAEVFMKRVRDGIWRTGEAIPSESMLAKEYGVAVGTIRQAIAKLAEDGVLVKRHGKSTTVSGGLSNQSMLRFFRYQLDSREQLNPEAKVLDFKTVSLDKEVARNTGWSCKTVLKIHRVRLIDDKPVLFETIYLPLPKFKKLQNFEKSDFENLFYPMYVRVCDVVVLKAHDRVSFELMRKADAKVLGFKEGHPGVRVDRVAFDLSSSPVEYRSSVADAMDFQYSVEVN